jgi:hypothetical protein
VYWPENKSVSVERNVHFGAAERLGGERTTIRIGSELNLWFRTEPSHFGHFAIPTVPLGCGIYISTFKFEEKWNLQ